ncbi:MAG: Rpn family recombination-promoting nuclease/putative transposase [Synergistaceae bacterium]|nr:Rpn family recombination-promoting nuclease/putative transposase [Synergistaceae bacterium]
MLEKEIDFAEIDRINRSFPFEQRWENLTLGNDFMFGKVFQDTGLCLELVKLILPELNIERIERLEQQKSAKETFDTHGVRFDVYLHDDKGRIIVLEMQIANRKDLPRRARSYHSSADLDARETEKHKTYDTMPEVIIVFICEFDPFGMGRNVYTFKNYCAEERNLMLDDGASTIFLNTKGKDKSISPGMKAFLDFVGGKSSDDKFVRRLEDRLSYAKHNWYWRANYVKDMLDRNSFAKECEERGIVIGEARGIAIGEARGEVRGIHKANVATALRLRQMGMNDNQISLATGLSFDEIGRL